MQPPTLSAPVIITLLSLADQAYAYGWDWCTVKVFYQGRTTGELLPTAKKVGIQHSFPGEGIGYAPYKFILNHKCGYEEVGRPWLTGMKLETTPYVPKAKYE
ncbi:hypothetical protein PspLS_04345 [Pyricularia sp. CBS 133598]|nr:hypothetical protein PspLS_04345 [Pyricularia sp. CBS 133598]